MDGAGDECDVQTVGKRIEKAKAERAVWVAPRSLSWERVEACHEEGPALGLVGGCLVDLGP